MATQAGGRPGRLGEGGAGEPHEITLHSGWLPACLPACLSTMTTVVVPSLPPTCESAAGVRGPADGAFLLHHTERTGITTQQHKQQQ